MKITIIAGTGYDKDGRSISDGARTDALIRIRNKLAAMFGGFSERAQYGGWYDGTGVVMEPGRAWTIFADDDAASPEIAATFVRNALNQESVGLVIEPAAVRWLGEEAHAVAA